MYYKVLQGNANLAGQPGSAALMSRGKAMCPVGFGGAVEPCMQWPMLVLQQQCLVNVSSAEVQIPVPSAQESTLHPHQPVQVVSLVVHCGTRCHVWTMSEQVLAKAAAGSAEANTVEPSHQAYGCMVVQFTLDPSMPVSSRMVLQDGFTPKGNQGWL